MNNFNKGGNRNPETWRRPIVAGGHPHTVKGLLLFNYYIGVTTTPSRCGREQYTNEYKRKLNIVIKEKGLL